MNTLEAITARRAVKHYDASHQISDEELDLILNHAILSPTAFNIQNWRFVVVKDAQLRQKIRENAWDQAQVTDASVLIVLVADNQAWAKDPVRYWKNAPQEVANFLVPAIGQYYEGRPETASKEGHRSCGMAGMSIMLAAKSLGYDTCPMDGFDYEKVGQLINLPKDHEISFMIALGKGTKEAFPRGGQLPLSEVVIENTF